VLERCIGYPSGSLLSKACQLHCSAICTPSSESDKSCHTSHLAKSPSRPLWHHHLQRHPSIRRLPSIGCRSDVNESTSMEPGLASRTIRLRLAATAAAKSARAGARGQPWIISAAAHPGLTSGMACLLAIQQLAKSKPKIWRKIPRRMAAKFVGRRVVGYPVQSIKCIPSPQRGQPFLPSI
jgi:hypothetical protein